MCLPIPDSISRSIPDFARTNFYSAFRPTNSSQVIRFIQAEPLHWDHFESISDHVRSPDLELIHCPIPAVLIFSCWLRVLLAESVQTPCGVDKNYPLSSVRSWIGYLPTSAQFSPIDQEDMAIADGFALADLIGKAVNFTRQTFWSYYKASKDMDVFKMRLADLRHQSDHWTSLLRKYNMENDLEIGSLLEQASQLLDQEQAKMEGLRSSWIRRSWKKLVFPETLTNAMEVLVSAFKRLSERLAERQANEEQLQRNTFNRVVQLPFAPDKKYVRFKSTIAAVRTALESETTGQVVTLFGGPGEGKSSMARYLALLYQNGSIAGNAPANVQEDKTLLTENLLSKRFPDGVFFYAYCRTTSSKDILVELWRDLGYQFFPPTAEAGQDQASCSDPAQKSLMFERSLHKELVSRLSNKKVLIVLDDVCEPKLIEKLLFPGQWVKYLITTQISRLWSDANCVAIPIKSPTSEEAYQLLRNQICGFPTHVAPQLKDAIDALIEQSGHSPLVLANMATYVRSEHASDLEEWKFPRLYLERLKKQHEDGQLKSVLFNRTYSKLTIQYSTTLAVDSFTTMEQTLLLLASICESQSIPEVVLKIFFKKIHGSLDWFPRCLENLQINTFIQIESKIVPWSRTPEKSWSIHTLRQEVISSIKKEEIASLVTKLLDCSTGDEIVVALLVLYGQEPWCDQAANKVMISRDQCSKNTEYGKSASLQLSTIKPFVMLLQVDGKELWEKTSYHLVEQVLHKYLSSEELDDDGISRLLAMQETTSSTLMALTKVATLKGSPFLTKNHPEIVHGLVDLLECLNANSGEVASWLLGQFSFEGLEDLAELQAFSDVMKRLLDLLAKDFGQNTKNYVAYALVHMTCQAVETRIKIGSFPGAIEQLVALLAEDVSPDTQKWASLTLGNLANEVQNCNKIGVFPGAIERLVELLAEDVSPDTQREAAFALGNLAKEVQNRNRIEMFPGAIERLEVLGVVLLAKDVSLDTQKWAIAPHRHLCSGQIACSQIHPPCP